MANKGVLQPVQIKDPIDASGNVQTSVENTVDVNIVSGSSSGTEYDDGDANGDSTGGLIMGDDGTNIQSLLCSAAGRLSVDVNSGGGGGGGTEYEDGDARGTPTGGLIMGDDGTLIQSIKVDAAGELQIDVVTQDGVAAEGAALGNGVLLQGDDGTDRKNIAVDATTGNIKVDIASGSAPGTEYDDGDANGNSTGGLIMGDDGTNVQSLLCSAAGRLSVDVNSGGGSASAIDVSGNTVDTDTITATSTTLVTVTGGTQIKIYSFYVATNDDFVPCTWNFQVGTFEMFHTRFVSKGANRYLDFGSGLLLGADGDNLVFEVDVSDANVTTTVIYEIV